MKKHGHPKWERWRAKGWTWDGGPSAPTCGLAGTFRKEPGPISRRNAKNRPRAQRQKPTNVGQDAHAVNPRFGSPKPRSPAPGPLSAWALRAVPGSAGTSDGVPLARIFQGPVGARRQRGPSASTRCEPPWPWPRGRVHRESRRSSSLPISGMACVTECRAKRICCCRRET